MAAERKFEAVRGTFHLSVTVIRHKKVRKKLVTCYIWSIAVYGGETWTLRKVDQKYFGSFEIHWRRTEKIGWTDRVRNEKVLQVEVTRA